MRYTLRLLTAQQFQRATALVCAAEMIRRERPATLGRASHSASGSGWARTSAPSALMTPKSRWSGPTTSRRTAHRSPESALPWCGTAIDGRSHVEADDDRQRVYVYCGDD